MPKISLDMLAILSENNVSFYSNFLLAEKLIHTKYSHYTV